jgi:type III restriction enzyme
MRMSNAFFERPILNSPYAYPARHWELGEDKQPTQRIVDSRRRADFVMPIPAPKKRKGADKQAALLFDERSTQEQQYDHTAVINAVRAEVDKWRALPNPNDWRVTPETARLLQHWRHHAFSNTRPFFCQVEAAETAIWLSEVAPQLGRSAERFIEHLANANQDANPGLSRLALKLATGAGKTTVMAMLIAWQTVNAVRRPGSKKFTRGFLIVAPGLTIRDRLRVLRPNDPDSYYGSRETGAERHARRPERPRSSSPTTTPSSCASASSCPRAAGSFCRAAPATRPRRWKPKARCSSA